MVAIPMPPSTAASETNKRMSFRFAALAPQPELERVRYERHLSDNEVAYFLPARADGVNDMYVQVGVKAPLRLMHRERVALAWAILRLRHPLLSSKIEMQDYTDIRLAYEPPSSPEAALNEAIGNMGWEYRTQEEVMESALNGPRLLANNQVSFLIVSRTPEEDPYPSPPPTPSIGTSHSHRQTPPSEKKHQYHVLISALHCLGDGMAMHALANDFFTLVGGNMSDGELRAYMGAEWEKHIAQRMADGLDLLPQCLEDSFPKDQGALVGAVARADFDRVLSKQIGGHAFARKKNPRRHIIIGKHTFEADVSKAMVESCKANGVSFAGAMFAACNISWARMTLREQQALPMMFYSAMNVRPFLRPRNHDSYMFLALGYFNIVLPSFIPSDCAVAKTFWHRARATKDQISKAQKTPMLIPRLRETTRRRAAQSRIWAREDDEKAAGTWAPSSPKVVASAPAPARAPSAALCGLSMLGNLDNMYTYDAYPDCEIVSLDNGPRLRSNGALMFAYTFLGKTTIAFYQDEGAIDPKSLAEFWDGTIGAMEEFMA